MNPLMQALYDGNRPAIRYLIESKAKIACGWTHRKIFLEILIALFKDKKDIEKIFNWLIAVSDVRGLRFYAMARRIDPNEMGSAEAPVVTAIRNKADLPTIEFLHEKGVDFLLPNREGETALELARKLGHTAFLEFYASRLKAFEKSLRGILANGSFKQLSDVSAIYGFVKRNVFPDELTLLRDEKGDAYFLPNKSRLRHSYSIGKSGAGKSMHLESLVLQDILAGRGGCAFDPYNAFNGNVVKFVHTYRQVCCRKNFEQIRDQAKKAHRSLKDFFRVFGLREIDPDLTDIYLSVRDLKDYALDLRQVFPELNVLFVDLTDPANSKESPNPHRINAFEFEPSGSGSVRERYVEDSVGIATRSVERHMKQSSTETPRALNVLNAVFSLAVVTGKSLRDLMPILGTLQGYIGHGKKYAKEIPEEFFRELAAADEPITENVIHYLKQLLFRIKKDATETIESTVNRLQFFLNSRFVRRLFDCPHSTLDLERIVNEDSDRRTFLLVNLPVSQPNAAMAATFLLTKIDQIVFSRTEEQRKIPFFMYVDEFFHFFDLQLAVNFSGIRNYGLGYTVAHQNFSQLQIHDPNGNLRETVQDNTDTKIIFKIEGNAAQTMADYCFELTGQLPKNTKSTSRTISEAVTESETVSSQESRSSSSSRSNSSSVGQRYSLKDISDAASSRSKTIGSGSSSSCSVASASAKTTSTQNSEAKGETVNYGYFSLDEEARFKAQEIRKLQARELFLALPGLRTYKGRTPDALTVKCRNLIEEHCGSANYAAILKRMQKRERAEMAEVLRSGRNMKEDGESEGEDRDLERLKAFEDEMF